MEPLPPQDTISTKPSRLSYVRSPSTPDLARNGDLRRRFGIAAPIAMASSAVLLPVRQEFKPSSIGTRHLHLEGGAANQGSSIRWQASPRAAQARLGQLHLCLIPRRLAWGWFFDPFFICAARGGIGVWCSFVKTADGSSPCNPELGTFTLVRCFPAEPE